MAGESQNPTLSVEEVIAKRKFRDESLEVVFVDQKRVACDGPGAGLGHPRTFYSIGDEGWAECGYCDRLFVYHPARVGEVIEGPAGLKKLA